MRRLNQLSICHAILLTSVWMEPRVAGRHLSILSALHSLGGGISTQWGCGFVYFLSIAFAQPLLSLHTSLCGFLAIFA